MHIVHATVWYFHDGDILNILILAKVQTPAMSRQTAPKGKEPATSTEQGVGVTKINEPKVLSITPIKSIFCE